jgi:hypothetical protein
MPDRPRDRGPDDDAAPPEFARLQRGHHGELPAGRRPHQRRVRAPQGSARPFCRRRAAVAFRRSQAAATLCRRVHAAGPPRLRPSAIHLGFDLRTQGRRGHPCQSAGQSRDDPPVARQHQAIDLCQLGAALSRHGADPEHAGSPLCRRALRSDGAERLHAAPAELAARHFALSCRGRLQPEFRIRPVRQPVSRRADAGRRPLILEGRAERRRTGAGRYGRAVYRDVRRPAPRFRPMAWRKRRC